MRCRNRNGPTDHPTDIWCGDDDTGFVPCADIKMIDGVPYVDGHPLEPQDLGCYFDDKGYYVCQDDPE